jgi:hypothetical protein
LLDWYLQALDLQDDPADILARKERIYFLRFDPTDARTPLPLEADLAWVWPAMLISSLLWRLLRSEDR